MAITKEIATKEKLRQNMRAIAPTDSGVKAEIERRIADLQTEIDALKEKARALEKQIGELQK
jgi:chaperonin cofactor prefoldin